MSTRVGPLSADAPPARPGEPYQRIDGSFRAAVVGPSCRPTAGANLTSADLTDAANLFRARLAGANLADANLTRVVLIEADLARVHLAGANLADAKLFRAVLPEGFVPPSAG